MANGVDVAAIDAARPGPAVRRELGLPEGAPVIGLVGRLDHWGKGHKELFTAMAHLQDRHPVHALIVGGGRRRPRCGSWRRAWAWPVRCISWASARMSPISCNAMDIFVLPSYSEGVSLALLEAMAAGQPVIATAVGGLPEVVTDGDKRAADPAPGRRRPWPRPWHRLLADPALARQLGENARPHVREHFSLDRLGREINEIYEELVEKSLGRGLKA